MFTRQRFQNKVVFITGAAHGMGRAHALAFAREGAKLVICDACRQYETVPYPLATPTELAALAGEIENMGNAVIAAQTDVTDLAAMQALAERAARTWSHRYRGCQRWHLLLRAGLGDERAAVGRNRQC